MFRTLHMMKTAHFIALALFLAFPLAAQQPNPSLFEPLLVPVFASGPGALGSQWTSTMTLLNSGQSAVTLAKPLLSGDPHCPAVCGCGVTAVLQPGSPAEPCPSFQNPSGVLLWIPRTTPEDDPRLDFSLRVRDVSRSVLNAGTEVPVVRERNLRGTQPFWLLNVDTDSGFRVALRFYDLLNYDQLPVHLRIYGVRSAVYLETTIQLSYPVRTLVYDPFPTQTAFAVIADLTAQFPELKDKGPVNIEIQFAESLADPPYAHKHTYAFASITNNLTQTFTTVTPQ